MLEPCEGGRVRGTQSSARLLTLAICFLFAGHAMGFLSGSSAAIVPLRSGVKMSSPFLELVVRLGCRETPA